MNLVKLQDDLYIPENFDEVHKYFVDEKAEKEYTGITTVLAIKAKPALIPWAVNEAIKVINANIKYRRLKAFKKGYVLLKESAIEEARTAHTKKKEAAGEHGTSQHSLVQQFIEAEIKRGLAYSS